jgi:hypothetical protein
MSDYTQHPPDSVSQTAAEGFAETLDAALRLRDTADTEANMSDPTIPKENPTAWGDPFGDEDQPHECANGDGPEGTEYHEELRRWLHHACEAEFRAYVLGGA